MKRLLFVLIVIMLICVAKYVLAKTEDGTSNVVPMMAYGTAPDGTIVPIKTTVDGSIYLH